MLNWFTEALSRIREVPSATIWSTILWGSAGTVAFSILGVLYRYRSSIRKRLDQIDKSRGMVRCEERQEGSFHLLELNSDFVETHKAQGWQLVSLGSYLASLKPAMLPQDKELPIWIQSELEATLAVILVKALGPRWGALLLPTLGSSAIDKRVQKFAYMAAHWWLSHIQADVASLNKENNNDAGQDEQQDGAAFPFSLFTMTAMANLNEATVRSHSAATPPLQLMEMGEVGYEPSFDVLIPNPFIVSIDWEASILRMEDTIRRHDHVQAKSTTEDVETVELSEKYDPDDCSLAAPKPLNERLLPGLCLGWGSAKCTHTKREILRNRLLAVLLNRLGHNYHLKEQQQTRDDDDDKSNMFIVQMDKSSKALSSPADFIQALQASGHVVSVHPDVQITTFGMSMCISEPDGSWSNVPLAFFIQSGYEDMNGKPAYVCMPHGGLDLDICGPLVGEGNKCGIQHYMAIEGLCGWHSNHNADVPWLKNADRSEPLTGTSAVQAVRMAGLTAVTLNAIGTEMNLPFGGYGLVGVCNDTAALVEQAMFGRTTVYPLTSTGRFLMHIVRRLRRMHNAFQQTGSTDCKDIEDLKRLIRATCEIGSDLHASPSNALDATKRFLLTQPKGLPFQLALDAKEIIERIHEGAANMKSLY